MLQLTSVTKTNKMEVRFMSNRIGHGRMRFDDGKFDKSIIKKNLIFRILKYFIPYRAKISIAILLLSLSSILGLAPSILVRSIIDDALPNKQLTYLLGLTLLLFLTQILLGLASLGQSYINTWISKKIIQDMKNQMFRHIESMSMKFFSLAKPGEIMTRMSSDIDGVQDVFNSMFVRCLSSIFTLISTAIILFYMNWKLAILSLIILPLFIIPTRKVGKLRWKIARKTQEKVSDMNQLIQESFSISGSILMKIFTKEDVEHDKFKSINKEITALQIKESIVGSWVGMVMNIFTNMGPMTMYLLGGYLYIKGELSIGSIVAFVSLLGRVYNPITQLSSMHIDLIRSLALFQRIFDYFDTKQDIADKIDTKDMPKIQGEIDFRNVHFSYNSKSEVLKGVDFRVKAGEMVALVGHSGAGKTTLTNLIPRLYDVSRGSVKIDGIDVRDVTMSSLRYQIGIVTQEPYLFNGTIKKNLLYGKEDASDEEIINACKAAYIHDFVKSLPKGYDTLVGNRGIKLSGGEKQRISIARVILKDPRIIILDEATSSLDSISEAYIKDTMKVLMHGKTSLVIAHRLSTIISADRIIVFNEGKIVEQGKHQELVRKDGIYRELYNKQFLIA